MDSVWTEMDVSVLRRNVVSRRLCDEMFSDTGFVCGACVQASLNSSSLQPGDPGWVDSQGGGGSCLCLCACTLLPSVCVALSWFRLPHDITIVNSFRAKTLLKTRLTLAVGCLCQALPTKDSAHASHSPPAPTPRPPALPPASSLFSAPRCVNS